jgi:hypothetical protein
VKGGRSGGRQCIAGLDRSRSPIDGSRRAENRQCAAALKVLEVLGGNDPATLDMFGNSLAASRHEICSWRHIEGSTPLSYCTAARTAMGSGSRRSDSRRTTP